MAMNVYRESYKLFVVYLCEHEVVVAIGVALPKLD